MPFVNSLMQPQKVPKAFTERPNEYTAYPFLLVAFIKISYLMLDFPLMPEKVIQIPIRTDRCNCITGTRNIIFFAPKWNKQFCLRWQQTYFMTCPSLKYDIIRFPNRSKIFFAYFYSLKDRNKTSFTQGNFEWPIKRENTLKTHNRN